MGDDVPDNDVDTRYPDGGTRDSNRSRNERHGTEDMMEPNQERPDIRRALDRHLIPWLFSLGIVCYLDRTNLSFAAVQLNRDLRLSCSTYGLGAGLFFLSYAVFQVPSSVILSAIGAPLWLGITVVVWGCVAASFAGVHGAAMFLVLRLLLGMAESGTFPGIWAHLARFYSPRELGGASRRNMCCVVVVVSRDCLTFFHTHVE